MNNDSERKAVAARTVGSSRRVVAWGLIALATVNVVFWLLFVQPLESREDEKQALIGAMDAQLKQKREALARLREATEKVSLATVNGDELLDSLTFERRTAFSKLLTELGDAAKEAGIEIRETDYVSGDVEGTETYGIISITANFRGDYASLVRFLNLLDRSKAFLIIERLGARPREDTGGLQISMRIDTFVRNSGAAQSTQTTAAANPKPETSL